MNPETPKEGPAEVPGEILDLERAVATLETRVKAEERPDRYDLRALLLALGALPEDPGQPDTLALWKRTQAAAAALDRGFQLAAQDELSLACAEHAHAVDPRYLDHPDYDFEYTLTARERLGQRLRAAAWLGVEPADALLTAVRAADERLSPYVKKRTQGRGEPE